MVPLALRASRDLGSGYHLFTLDEGGAPSPPAPAPGQFYMLEVPGLLLRRPLSLAWRREGELGFLLKLRGAGTRALAALAPGASVSVLGPCGRGFGPLAPGDVLVGGGIGCAPLLGAALAEVAAGREPPPFIVGLKGPAERELGAYLAAQASVRVVYESGGSGPGRTALDELADVGGRATPSRVLACGPEPFMAAVARWAAARAVPCLVSVEARMGCGFGACLGCAVPARSGGYLMACSDGPVLDASAVAWEGSA